MKSMRASIWICFATVVVAPPTIAAGADGPGPHETPVAPSSTQLPLVVDEKFVNGASRWQPTDPDAWKLLDIEGTQVFSQFAQSRYKPPHSSPYNFALLKDVQVNDFVLEIKVRSTVKDYKHRDVCLFFGIQDPAHFYYVHFGLKADSSANQIFKVDAADRIKISEKSSAGVKWTDDWHRLKIVRNLSDGLIESYFDDMRTPIMVAHDKTFGSGGVGIGTFDDTADFAEVKLWGVEIKPAE